MALAVSNVKRCKLGSNGIAVVGQITASGNYATGGDTLDLSKVPGITNRKPDFVRIQGMAGYMYEYDAANGKMLCRQVASADHTHDIKLIGGITATEPVAVQGGDTLGKNAATDRTIAGATSATKGGVVTATLAAAAGAELPASSYPSGVTGDTIKFFAVWLTVPNLPAI